MYYLSVKLAVKHRYLSCKLLFICYFLGSVNATFANCAKFLMHLTLLENVAKVIGGFSESNYVYGKVSLSIQTSFRFSVYTPLHAIVIKLN